MDRLHLDFETRSRLNLKRVGSHLYSLHPSTNAWCFAWAFNDEPVTLWENLALGGDENEPIPARILEHIAAGGIVSGFSVQFEWHIWNNVLRRDMPELPELDYRQLDCTQARAVVMGLPRSLEMVGYALNQSRRRGANLEKDKEGHRLMLQMAKPRHDGPKGLVWWDDYQRRQRLGRYCIRDVEAERWVEQHLRPLTKRHRELWLMDFRMNYIRGVQIDVPLIRRAQEVVLQANRDASAELARITGSRVLGVTKLEDMKAWLATRGVRTDSLDKAAVAALLANPKLDQLARHAIEIRQAYGKSSVAKIPAFLERTDEHGRMHGMLLFNGAGPGRWTGQGAQLHNLPRPELSADEVLRAVRILRDPKATPREKVALLTMLYDAPLPPVSDAIRGFIIASHGKRLFVRDYSNIEGRGIAWLAGEKWKLDAFAAYDAGTGPDLYRLAAAGIFGCSVEDIDDYLRQIGKSSELALGFQGGAEALDKMATKYQVKLLDYQGVIYGAVPAKLIGRAEWGWDTYGHRTGMERSAWLVAEVIKLAWREKNPAIVELWHMLNETAILAMKHPGTLQAYRRVMYQYGNIMGTPYLLCRLPSGRLLYYPYAQLRVKQTEWGERQEYIQFQSTHPVTKRWDSFAGYGGLWAENATQGYAFDLIADAMLRGEQLGFPPVLSVHDENIAEADEDADEDIFDKLMRARSPWSPDMPIAVSGFSGRRYRK